MEYHTNGRWWCITACDMRQALACQADFWRQLYRLSCSTTTAGSWFQSPTVLVANELRSPDEDAPIALNLNRWFALVQLSAGTKPIWSGPLRGFPSEYRHPVWYRTEKMEWWWWKKFEDMFIRFDMIHERDRQTDRRTPAKMRKTVTSLRPEQYFRSCSWLLRDI